MVFIFFIYGCVVVIVFLFKIVYGFWSILKNIFGGTIGMFKPDFTGFEMVGGV